MLGRKTMPVPQKIDPSQINKDKQSSVKALDRKQKIRILFTTIVPVIIILLLIGLFTAFRENNGDRNSNAVSKENPVNNVNNEKLPQLGAASNGRNITEVVFNQTIVSNDSIVLSPSLQPTESVTGQLYYDETTDQINIYRNNRFEPLLSTTEGQQVCFVGADCGFLTNIDIPDAVTLPQDLSVTATPTFNNLALNGQLQVSNGGTGASSFTNNALLVGNGSGVISTSNIPSSGQILISSLSGVPQFVSVSGDAEITSSGVINLNTNTVSSSELASTAVTAGTYGNGANYPVFTVDADGRITAASQSLLPGGGVGVGSLNSLVGSLTLQGTANQVSVVSGVSTLTLSTPQDIATTSSPTFNSLNLTNLIIGGDTLTDLTGQGLSVNTGALSVNNLENLAGTLDIASGGTGTSSLTLNGLVYGNGTGALQVTAAGTTGQCLIGATGSAPVWGGCPGDGVGLSSLNGQTGSTQTFTNGTNVTISSTGNIHSLGWTGQLAVANGGTGAGNLTPNGVLFGNGTGAIQTTSAGASGQTLIANGSGVPVFVSLSGDLTVNAAGSTTIGANAVTLSTDTTGDYVATITNGSGLSGSSSSEGGNPTLALGAFTNNWNQTGAFDLILDNASSELQIRGSGGAFYARLDAGALTVDETFTLPAGYSGTICTTAGNCSGVGGTGDILNNGQTGAVTIGTNDATSLSLETNNSPRLALSSTGVLSIPNLVSCDSIDTDASGVLSCGVDGGDGVGISSLNGLTNSAQTFVDDTNVSVVSAGSTHTITWSGTLAVSRGGTGSTTASGARINLGAAASGANSDITSITGLTTELSVSQGGTGTSSLTLNGLVYGNGTGALQVTAAGTTGQCLIGATGSAPVWGGCPGDGVGLSSLNGQTGSTQTFTNGTNVTISSTGNIHSLGWTGQLAVANGGTGASGAQGAINTISGLTTEGDLLFRDSTNSTRLARGADTQCLVSNTTTILWDACTGDGVGTTTVGTLNGGTANVNGATISSTTLFLQSASANFAGVVDTASQTFSGVKTFNNGIVLGSPSVAGSLAISDGTFNTVTILANATSGSYNLSIPTLTGDDSLCLGSGNCSGLGGLQSSYDSGNTIVTTDARDLSFTLADTTTDSNFKLTVAAGSSSAFQIYDDSSLAVSYDTANGFSVPGSGASSEQFGFGAGTGSSNFSLAVGNNAFVSGASGTAIGSGAKSANEGVSLGASASGGNGVAIGWGSGANLQGIAIGNGAKSNMGLVYNGIALGNDAIVKGSGGIAIGAFASAQANQLVVGADGNEISEAYFGEGARSATPTAFSLNATGGLGANVAGADLTVAGGRGTGSGAGGSLLFQTASSGGSGSALRTLTTRLTIDQAGLATFANSVAVNGTASFRANVNSSASFLVQNSSGVSLLAVDSASQSLVVNRETDGTLVELQVAGVVQGTITAASGTVSYNAFTGSHYGLFDSTLARSGELVDLTGNNRYKQGSNEPIYVVSKTTVANSPNVLGAYLATQDPSKTPSLENPELITAAGNGEVWIADNGSGNLAIGDQLISSGDVAGHAMRDNGQFEVAHVFAKAAEPVDWSLVTDTVSGTKVAKVSILFSYYNSTNTVLTSNSALQGASLNITSDAVFGGDVTIVGNLNTTGAVAVGSLEVTESVNVAGDLTVQGLTALDTLEVARIISTGNVPTVVELAGAGVDGSLPTDPQVLAVITGNDTAGVASVTTGVTSGIGELIEVTFDKAYNQAPVITLTPLGQKAATLQYYVVDVTTDGFKIGSATPTTEATTYRFQYQIIQ